MWQSIWLQSQVQTGGEQVTNWAVTIVTSWTGHGWQQTLVLSGTIDVSNAVTTIVELFISELKPQCLFLNEYIMVILKYHA